MPNLLVRRDWNGLLFRQNSLLVRATATSLAAFQVCCCGLACSALECDCTASNGSQGTQYKARKKVGDFTGCDSDCLDSVDDDWNTAGGGSAGAGIPMDETGLPGVSCEFAKSSITYCDCDSVPPSLTPANLTLTISCENHNGGCAIKGTLTLGSFTWTKIPFDVTADSTDKQAFTETTASACCTNIPDTIDVWRSAG